MSRIRALLLAVFALTLQLFLPTSSSAQGIPQNIPRKELLILENPEGTIKNAGWFNIWAINAGSQSNGLQQAALDTLQNAAAKSKDILEASCPTEMPATPLGRLSAMEQRLQTISAAVATVRGPLNDFYGSLSDEQKAQFNMIGRTRPTKTGLN